MDISDDYEQKIAGTIEEIYDLQLEALRRAGVAKEKEEGLKIESTEAVRLFREATGYLLRLRELRFDLESELHDASYYHIERVIGNLEDYNRILRDIKKNDSFVNAVSEFDEISYKSGDKTATKKGGYTVRIGNRSAYIKGKHTITDMRGNHVQENVPMNGTTKVETFVLPRLIRLSKDLENSIIGRCASGKRPG